MERIPFSQRLREAKIDVRSEYNRLYELFGWRLYGVYGSFRLVELCEEDFMSMPFRDTCVSLDDFTKNHVKCQFPKQLDEADLNTLILFCEYSYNLARNCKLCDHGAWDAKDIQEAVRVYLQQVERLIEKIGYMPNTLENVVDFVPKDQAAIAVAEIVEDDLSYRIIEYNHHSMKGDMIRKKEVLKKLGDKLEPLRESLRSINRPLESNLFMLLNKMNIRHNNVEKEGKNYEPYVAEMSESTLEEWYDETYQLCLLAFLELDNNERRKRLDELRQNLG